MSRNYDEYMFCNNLNKYAIGDVVIYGAESYTVKSVAFARTGIRYNDWRVAYDLFGVPLVREALLSSIPIMDNLTA